MRQFLFLIISLFLSILSIAQTKKTQSIKPVAKPKVTVTKKSGTTSKTAGKPVNKTTVKSVKTTKNTRNTKAPASSPTTKEIKGLQGQREEIKRKIRQQEAALKVNQANVKKRLQNLMIINTEIGEKKKSIETIQRDITTINSNIDLLNSQLSTLERQLQEAHNKYLHSVRYMSRHRRSQDKLMFIFSADNFTQMYRRLRFVKQYASYQRAQGKLLEIKQEQVSKKQNQLQEAKGKKNSLLAKDQSQHEALQTQQDEQQKVVESLQKQQKTIQTVLTDQRKKDAELNAQIDRLVAIEVEKARQRAAEETRKRAEVAEQAKKKAEELAKKKAEAEAKERENARLVAEARERERRAAEQVKIASQGQREGAEREAKRAEAERRAAEKKAEIDRRRDEKDIAAARKVVDDAEKLNAVDRMLSGGFEANKGRLPMPITGNYKIVSHFGQYNVEGLKGVTLDNKGINILGSSEAMARSIYDGEVSAVFNYSGITVVMVRHGAYISVYCNLRSASVAKGQKVATRQALGAIAPDGILQFQLRRETSKLNPELWLRR